MGPEGAVNIIFRKELDAAKDKDKERKRLVDDYRHNFANPYIAAEKGYIDEVIEPKETRTKVIRALNSLLTKTEERPRKKHGNIPL